MVMEGDKRPPSISDTAYQIRFNSIGPIMAIPNDSNVYINYIYKQPATSVTPALGLGYIQTFVGRLIPHSYQNPRLDLVF